MKKLKKLLLVGLAVASVSSGLIAYAERVDKEGGTWVYGKHAFNAFSEYYHSYNQHGAKVVNANNGNKDYKNAGPGVWAKASIWNIWDPSTYYYNPTGHYSE